NRSDLGGKCRFPWFGGIAFLKAEGVLETVPPFRSLNRSEALAPMQYPPGLPHMRGRRNRIIIHMNNPGGQTTGGTHPRDQEDADQEVGRDHDQKTPQNLAAQRRKNGLGIHGHRFRYSGKVLRIWTSTPTESCKKFSNTDPRIRSWSGDKRDFPNTA